MVCSNEAHLLEVIVHMSNRQNSRKTKGKWTWDVQISVKTFTTDRGPPTYRYHLFLHIARRYKPSRPIGDHPLWPCPLRVASNFVRLSYPYGLPISPCPKSPQSTKICEFSMRIAEEFVGKISLELPDVQDMLLTHKQSGSLGSLGRL